MQSINDYSDNELKYNILGVNSLKNPNYNIIKDINNYLEDYENIIRTHSIFSCIIPCIKYLILF